MSMLSQKHSGCQEIQLSYRLTGFSLLETGYLTKEVSILHASYVSVHHLAGSVQILCPYVLYDRPRMVHRLPHIICPHESLKALFPHIPQSDFRMDTLNHQNPQIKAWPLLNHENYLQVCVLLVASS
jgi:hypothetical protein